MNEDVFASRDIIVQAVPDLFAHAAEDHLPGVTPARLATSTALMNAYLAPAAPEGNAQKDATTFRDLRDAAFAELLRLRHEIQFAGRHELVLARRSEHPDPTGVSAARRPTVHSLTGAVWP